MQIQLIFYNIVDVDIKVHTVSRGGNFTGYFKQSTLLLSADHAIT